MYSKRLVAFAPMASLLFSSSVAMWEEPSTQDRIRGNYENKIRFFAAPEKIFETFATIRDETGVFMSYRDFFHSLTPYNYSSIPEEKEDYFEKHTPEIMKIVDVNNDK